MTGDPGREGTTEGQMMTKRIAQGYFEEMFQKGKENSLETAMKNKEGICSICRN